MARKIRVLDEPEQIRTADWRLQAIGTLTKDWHSDSGIVHKAGAVVGAPGMLSLRKRDLMFLSPNPAALYLSAAQRLGAAAQDYIEAVLIPRAESAKIGETIGFAKEEETPLFDAFESLMACVILSFTGLEAWANSVIPEDYRYEANNPRSRCTEIYVKKQIEMWIDLDTKLTAILPDILKVKSPKDSAPQIWNRYKKLKNLRDELIHLKSTHWQHQPDKVGAPDKHLWTALVQPHVSKSHDDAYEMILHFYPKDHTTDRWMAKYPLG